MTYYGKSWPGSSGIVIPGVSIKLVAEDGTEVTAHDQQGEVLIASQSVMLGYHRDERANHDTFVVEKGRKWLRTGDIGMFRRADSGNVHLFVVGRIKELIKVKGLQVSPAELEDCLMRHSAVADCAVVGVPDTRAGELPKAFIRRSPASSLHLSEDDLAVQLIKQIETKKAHHKWLKGGIVFVDSIPRSPSGKLLRRELRALQAKPKL